MIAIDHISLVVGRDAFEKAALGLAAAGLTESFRGAHPGQGTTNIFYCFDNAFLELLCVASPAEAKKPPVNRLGLAPRADWLLTGAFPLGIALRLVPKDQALSFETWDYIPPGGTYLKPTVVATDSDDVRRPFIFRAQRLQPPRDWTDGKARNRQVNAGFAELADLRLELSSAVPPGKALRDLESAGLITLEAVGRTPGLSMAFKRSSGDAARILRWPDLEWHDG